jgi:hypothetical protein
VKRARSAKAGAERIALVQVDVAAVADKVGVPRDVVADIAKHWALRRDLCGAPRPPRAHVNCAHLAPRVHGRSANGRPLLRAVAVETAPRRRTYNLRLRLPLPEPFLSPEQLRGVCSALGRSV